MPEAASAVLFIAALITTGARAMICALVFLVFSAHLLISDYMTYLDGLSYYGTAAIFDGVLIALLIRMPMRSALSADVMSILLVIIMINFAGWIIYELGFAPAPYDYAMLLANVILVIRLLIRTGRDGRDRASESGFWGTMVYRPNPENRYSRSKV